MWNVWFSTASTSGCLPIGTAIVSTMVSILTSMGLRGPGCSFGGPLWQLWVNHALAHAEAARRGAQRASLLVCAPRDNEALLRDGRMLSQFRALLREPDTAGLLALDDLIDRIALVVGEGSAWAVGLRARYGRI